jgi:serine/threonine protein kinase
MSLAGESLDRYRLLKQIGSGGMGEVYLAEDTAINRQIAIKVIRPQLSTGGGDGSLSPEVVRLFVREARAVARLDHPNILPLYDFGDHIINDIPYIYMVMPFRSDGTLRDWLRRRPSAVLAPEEVTFFLQQAASALQHAHNQQIIHQDIKPSNFLVRANAERPELPDILLADFGIAKSTAPRAVDSSVHKPRGTPAYMAPEQWHGLPVFATDQYALGIMAYELLTGIQPFQGTWTGIMYAHMRISPAPPSKHDPRITPALDHVVMRALAKLPADRYPSVLDFARAFREASGLAISTWQTSGSMAPIVPAASERQPSSAQTPVLEPQEAANTPSSWEQQTESPPSFYSTRVPSAAPDQPLLVPPTDAGKPASSPVRVSTTRIWLLSGLIAVVILAGSLGTLLLVNNPWVKHNVSPTTTPQQTRIPTPTIPANPQTRATATAQALQEATLATSNPYDNHEGTLVLNDALQKSDKQYRWDEEDSGLGGGCKFANQAYHAYMLLGIADCNANFMQFKDFAFQAEMKLINGMSGGLIVRAKPGEFSFYYCYLASDGSYGILLYVSGNTSPEKVLASGNSPAIRAGTGKKNLLGVVARGDTLELYVNLQRIATVHDSTHKQGYVGVASRSWLDPAEAVFTNARIWKLA